jgi:membrane-associated phospholipid phosphatase
LPEKLAILRGHCWLDGSESLTLASSFSSMATVSEPRSSAAGKSIRLDRAPTAVDSQDRGQAIVANSTWVHLVAGPAILALFGVAALTVDMRIAHWVRGRHYPSDLKKLFDLAEVFGHGFGAAFILMSVWVLAPDKRWRLPRTICAAFAAGMAGTVLKLCLSRQRPNRVVHFHIGALESFGDWFPLFSNTSGWQSFPSGHSALAAGLAVALTSLFPRGKWLFATLAAMVMLQRIGSGYHFLSDTLWGASIGWLIASACLANGWLTRPLARLEQQLLAQS